MINTSMNKLTNFCLTELLPVISSKYEVEGNPQTIYIDNISSPYHANETSLVFIDDYRSDKDRMFCETKASAIICTSLPRPDSSTTKCYIQVKNPKYSFA